MHQPGGSQDRSACHLLFDKLTTVHVICSSRYMMRPCTLKTYAAYRLKMSSNARNVIPKLGDAEHLARAHMGDAHAGTPGGRLEFGMMNDEIQHEASTCNSNSQLELPRRGHRPSFIRHQTSPLCGWPASAREGGPQNRRPCCGIPQRL